MGKHERRAYLEQIRGRYQRAKRADKAKILDEFCAVCGYHRKHAIRLLKRRRKAQPKVRPGRKPRFDHPQLLQAIRTIWLASDQMCSKKLKAALPLWIPHYEAEYGPLEPAVKALLEEISTSTLDRLLKPIRVEMPGKGLSGTKPGTLLKNQIPIRTDNWDISQPGFVEADTVAHCGNSLAGDFVWSLTLTDIHTGWTECRATWNKGAEGVVAQIKSIEKALPFRLKGFDCDNGSEFLNYHLLRYFANHRNKPGFTRSRPYKKNDNAHVEQKNWTQVRQLFGYHRFDDPLLVDLMNDLYANEWSLLQNYFSPSMKLKEKTRVGSRYVKKYHDPETPYQRIMDSPHITKAKKRRLESTFLALNPFELKRRIEAKLKLIFKHVSVTSIVRQRI
ncbi:MAG: integrase [Betaproteobacteria bacterium]|nr:integrase [Betaproteobacteria bacterium]